MGKKRVVDQFTSHLEDASTVSEIVDKLLPEIMRVKRIGRTILVFFNAPTFTACFDGTGADFTKEPLDWLFDIDVLIEMLRNATEKLSTLVKTFSDVASQLAESNYPMHRLLDNGTTTLQMIGRLTDDFYSQLDDAGVGRNQSNQSEWCKPVPGGLQGEGWWYLAGENFVPDVDPDSWEADRNRLYRENDINFRRWIGGLQAGLLLKLKLAAENAIYVEKWYELLREGMTVPISTKLEWSNLTHVEKKIIETLANSRGVALTGVEIARRLKMLYSGVEGQLKKAAKLRSNGLVDIKGGPKGGASLTESGWEFHNTRPTGLEF